VGDDLGTFFDRARSQRNISGNDDVSQLNLFCDPVVSGIGTV
jgi:hypothetical protein